jgi:transcriptional regulator with XRE-family HTH domain
MRENCSALFCSQRTRFLHSGLALPRRCFIYRFRCFASPGWKVTQAQFPSISVRNYSDLIVAIRAVKEFLGLSNETLEEIAGLTRGHVDKILGPSREKRIGHQTLPLILGALGIRLRVEVDPEQARCVASRWVKRDELQVRHRKPRPALWFADEAELGNGDANGHAANGHA